MSVSVKWANVEKSALILSFVSPWAWEDYEAVSASLQQAFESVTHDVDLIVDLQNAGDIPDTALVHIRDAYADSSLNLRQYIYVGAPPSFVEKLTTVDHYFTALGGELQYQCVDTLKEAQCISLCNHLVTEQTVRFVV